MAEGVGLIWGEREAEYLCGRDWTGQITLIRHDKLHFWRKSIELQRRSCRRMSAVSAKT
jgi:hypothetical protein